MECKHIPNRKWRDHTVCKLCGKKIRLDKPFLWNPIFHQVLLLIAYNWGVQPIISDYPNFVQVVLLALWLGIPLFGLDFIYKKWFARYRVVKLAENKIKYE